MFPLDLLASFPEPLLKPAHSAIGMSGISPENLRTSGVTQAAAAQLPPHFQAIVHITTTNSISSNTTPTLTSSLSQTFPARPSL